MGKLYKTRALVLFRRPFRDSDEIVGLLTPRQGRLDVVVRGSKKYTSELIGKLEPFVELEAMFAVGRKFDQLVQASVVRSFFCLDRRYDRLCWGSFFLELGTALGDYGEGESLYTIVLRSLKAVEKAETFRLIACWTEWNILTLLGYEPHTFDCARCGNREVEAFSWDDGGLICRTCWNAGSKYSGNRKGMLLTRRLVLMVQHLHRLDLDRACNIALEVEEAQLLESIVWRHWCACELPWVRARKIVEMM